VKIENGKLNVYIGYDYAETLEIWADSICAQESESERVRTLAEYMYRSLGNINSLTLYVFERYVGFKDPKLAEEYLDWAVKSIDALIKTTAEKLLTPPKEQKFPVPNSTKISNNEINIAGRIITKTLARGLQEDNKECLISWDEIPGNDSGKLIKILKEDFDVDWIEKAIFEKIDDGATIRVSTGKNSLSLKINDEKTRVDLNIDDGRSYQFTVLYEKYIYYQGYPPCDR
jgi:hypothetical protein